MNALNCLRCQTPMVEGFIKDETRNGLTDQEWVEGPVVKSFWLGLNTKGRERHHVRTWRCPRCGYLENYAIESAT